ncbi:MAG: hypothetical protein GY943_37100, partial [Chloroflexi bacterium]|nr:hypothetical protein [Chloroflexota bacterium]
GKSTPQRIWVAPGIIIALILFAIFATGFPDFAINTWRFILLGMMTIGNVTLIVLLIIKARQFGLIGTAVLFTLNIIIAFTMSGLARIPDQTIPLQWTEQLLNSFGQGAFMLAAFQLAKAVSVQNKTAVPAD